MLHPLRYGVPGSCCLAIGDGANDVAMIKVGCLPLIFYCGSTDYLLRLY